MKRKYNILLMAFAITVFLGCEKNAVQKIATPITDGAFIKYFNFTVNTATVNSPAVNFYANGVKVTAAQSTTGSESPNTGVAYAAVYPSTNAYTVIPAGTYDIQARIPSTATADANLVLTSVNKSLVNGQSYSLYTCGLYNSTTKKSDVFVVDDALPPVDTSGVYVRFVNASYNTNPINLILKNTTTNVETVIATSIAYKSASNFVKLPSGVYDLMLRYPGSSVNTVIRTAVSAVKANTYTFSLRGDITVPYTAAATVLNRPFIDNTLNR